MRLAVDEGEAGELFVRADEPDGVIGLGPEIFQVHLVAEQPVLADIQPGRAEEIGEVVDVELGEIRERLALRRLAAMESDIDHALVPRKRAAVACRPLHYPFTHTTCFSVCTTSTRSDWAAMTASMSL